MEEGGAAAVVIAPSSIKEPYWKDEEEQSRHFSFDKAVLYFHVGLFWVVCIFVFWPAAPRPDAPLKTIGNATCPATSITLFPPLPGVGGGSLIDTIGTTCENNATQYYTCGDLNGSSTTCPKLINVTTPSCTVLNYHY